MSIKDVPVPEDYFVSTEWGFLYPNPVQRLPDEFSAWNDIALNLCQLLEKKELKNSVDKMPLLDHTLLSGEGEEYCAYTFLSFMCNAYVWQDRDQVPEVLPEQLAVPLWELSESLELQPLLTYASFALLNWKLKDPNKPFNIDDNVDCIVSLPKYEEFHWFCVASCGVEKAFASAVQPIHDALVGVVASDVVKVKTALSAVTETLKRMKTALSRMHDRLSGAGFNNVIRPFLFGFGGDRSLLKDGLVYEGISDDPVHKIGQSAAQSSTIQCIDGLLGIVHDPDRKQILLKVRSYMRPNHAKFIEAIENGPSVKTFVITSKDDSLNQAYDETVTALQQFRSYHVQIVAKFIVVPAAKAKTKGTTLMPWLKGLRDDTLQNKLQTGSSDLNMNTMKTATEDIERQLPVKTQVH